MDCSPPSSSVYSVFQARILEWAAVFYSRDLPDPGIEPAFLASPALAGNFFTTVPPGKPFSYFTTSLRKKKRTDFKFYIAFPIIKRRKENA